MGRAAVAVLVLLAVGATAVPLLSGVPLFVVAVAWVGLGIVEVSRGVVRGRLFENAFVDGPETDVTAATRRDLRELADSAGVSRPTLKVVPIDGFLALVSAYPVVATVTVSEGLLDALGPAQRRAMLAHELGHVRRWDSLIEAAGSTVVNGVGLAAFWWWALSGAPPTIQLFGAVFYVGLIVLTRWPVLRLITFGLAGFTPLLAVVPIRALSRWQEHCADAAAAEMIADPGDLAQALEVLRTQAGEAGESIVEIEGAGTESGDRPFRGLLDPYPSFERRIQRLREM